MLYCSFDEVHVEYLQEIRFVLGDFDLFDKGLEKDLNWNGSELSEDLLQVGEDKLSHGLFLMVLNK